jgi:hypothetical protein
MHYATRLSSQSWPAQRAFSLTSQARKKLPAPFEEPKLSLPTGRQAGSGCGE